MIKKNWIKNYVKFIHSNRKKIGLSQAEFAKATGMNTSYISRLETGDNFQSVKIDFFLKVADIFEIEEREIMKKVGLR
jgi:transcriptional regulator with XRE-family HTH domain